MLEFLPMANPRIGAKNENSNAMRTLRAFIVPDAVGCLTMLASAAMNKPAIHRETGSASPHWQPGAYRIR